jgi:hypothetical protein
LPANKSGIGSDRAGRAFWFAPLGVKACEALTERLGLLRSGLSIGRHYGAVAVGSKFIAQDHYWLRVFIDTRAYDRIPGMVVSYIVLLIVLGLLGAVFAVASKENQEMKLLAIAVSAPALITTWLGGTKPPETPTLTRAPFEWLSPISPALAADKSISVSTGFWDGFKIPFGVGKDEARYYVIAGPLKTKMRHLRLAQK